MTAIAASSLSAGKVVNIYNASGTTKVRLADSSLGYDVNGFITSSYSINDSVTVYGFGSNSLVSGLTVGQNVYLSTSGGVTTTVPTSGLVQLIGTSISATEFFFSTEYAVQVDSSIVLSNGTLPIEGVIVNVAGGSYLQATAIDNHTNIINALASYRKVTIPPNLGDVFIEYTIEVPSNTELVVGTGTWLRRRVGTCYHLLRNSGAHGGAIVNGLTISGGSITIPEAGHPRKVGDIVYVEGFLGNTTLNGFKTIASVVAGVSWSYAATGSNPTNTALQMVFISRSNQLAGSNFVRSSNVTTVTETGHSRAIGDRVYIAGLSGTNSFNGAFAIASVTTNTWTYANTGANETATGTAQLLGDRNINVRFNGHGSGSAMTWNAWHAHFSSWGNVSQLQMNFTVKEIDAGRGATFYNVSAVEIPYAMALNNVAVLVQFDSYCYDVHIGTSHSANNVDDNVAWGTTAAAGAFGDTAMPTGPGSMSNLTVDLISGKSATGLLKLFATTGTNIGHIKIGRICGIGPILAGDPTTGVTGGSMDYLKIDTIDLTTLTSSMNQFITSGLTIKTIDIGTFLDGETSTSATGYMLILGSAIERVTIEKLISTNARTSAANVLFDASTLGTFAVNYAETAGGSGGIVFQSSNQVVNDLIVSNWKHVGTGVGNGRGIFSQTTGYFKNIQLSNVSFKDSNAVFGTSNSGSQTHNINVTNGIFDNVGHVFGSDSAGTFNIYASNLTCSSTSNNMLQFYTASTTVRFTGRGIKAPSAQWALFTSTTAYTIDCYEFAIDMGANAGSPPSQLSPATGNMITNTNATGGGVYGRTAAGAWLKVF